ncbi:MAG: PilZ domain-containing protein [Candidatus Omnitrophica bacterium]|nr:PilZ domain-containing protein [Candidatus Omnitrophota bacterium]
MVRLLALWAAALGVVLLLVMLREERLAEKGKVPVGRLRRFWLKSERRIAPRFRVDWPIQYERVEGDSQLAATRDVSQTGIGLIVRERLEAGSLLRLALTLPDEARPISLTGRVMWARPIPEALQPSGSSQRFFFVGIHFQAVPPELSVRVQKVLEKIHES